MQYAHTWGPYSLHLPGEALGVIIPTTSLGLGCFCPSFVSSCSGGPVTPTGGLQPSVATPASTVSPTAAPVNFTVSNTQQAAPSNGKQATSGVVVSFRPRWGLPAAHPTPTTQHMHGCMTGNTAQRHTSWTAEGPGWQLSTFSMVAAGRFQPDPARRQRSTVHLSSRSTAQQPSCRVVWSASW